MRNFLAVHGPGSEPCPACGGTISEIKGHGRMTNLAAPASRVG